MQNSTTCNEVDVRGIRLNQVSPVGVPWDPEEMLRGLAPRLRERNWHVQWYLRRAQLASLVPLQDKTGLTFVLDHLAGTDATTAPDDPAWAALAALADRGCWVKLSGWYRLKASVPFDAVHAPLQRVAGMFGANIVWGSDWPHTSLAEAAELPYAPLGSPSLKSCRPRWPTPCAGLIRCGCTGDVQLKGSSRIADDGDSRLMAGHGCLGDGGERRLPAG